MKNTVDESLAKISKGSGINFVGVIATLGLGFLGRLLIARHFTQSEFGVFALALVIFNIFTLIATMGLQQGVARNIAFSRGQNDPRKINQFITASVQLSVLSSVIMGIVLFFSSDTVAQSIFHDVTLTTPLRILSIGVPLFTLVDVLVSIPLGFDDAKPRVYFQNILRNVLFPIMLLVVIFGSLSFEWVFYAFLIALLIPLISLLVFHIRIFHSPINAGDLLMISPLAKELIIFSLPLLGIAALQFIAGWTDTLMLGNMEDSEAVGTYNAAFTFAHLITAPISAMILIYLPIVSRLYAQGAMLEIKKVFSISTKWLFSISLPVFLFLFLFAERLLSMFFGSEYSHGADALQILSIGFIVGALLGPNGTALIALGQTQFLMWITLVSAILNVGLNLALIPRFGIEGAAIASAISLTAVVLVRGWRLFSLSQAQPFSRNLIKASLVTLAIVLPTHFGLDHLINIRWWLLPVILAAYYIIYALAIILTRSIDREDISLLLAIEDRTGINAGPLKKILRRFV